MRYHYTAAPSTAAQKPLTPEQREQQAYLRGRLNTLVDFGLTGRELRLVVAPHARFEDVPPADYEWLELSIDLATEVLVNYVEEE